MKKIVVLILTLFVFFAKAQANDLQFVSFTKACEDSVRILSSRERWKNSRELIVAYEDKCGNVHRAKIRKSAYDTLLKCTGENARRIGECMMAEENARNLMASAGQTIDNSILPEDRLFLKRHGRRIAGIVDEEWLGGVHWGGSKNSHVRIKYIAEDESGRRTGTVVLGRAAFEELKRMVSRKRNCK